jgi:hypothetical protein
VQQHDASNTLVHRVKRGQLGQLGHHTDAKVSEAAAGTAPLHSLQQLVAALTRGEAQLKLQVPGKIRKGPYRTCSCLLLLNCQPQGLS